MEPDFRQARLAQLRSAQNKDGGWGYFPQRQSWLEPTCYAMLALYGDRESRESCDRAWALIRSWQNADGGFRPAAHVPKSGWGTALAVTLHTVCNVTDGGFRNGVQWLLGMRGTEGTWIEKVLGAIGKLPNDYDPRFVGWPWSPDAASWIEPTAHSLVALKKALGKPGVPADACRERIAEGERMIADRRASDGGWNYGNKRVLKIELPSYPETTGVALLGLQGARADFRSALDTAWRFWRETRSPLARAWLAISLRNYGKPLPPPSPSPPGSDVLITALEAIASPEGGHQWLKTA